MLKKMLIRNIFLQFLNQNISKLNGAKIVPADNEYQKTTGVFIDMA